MPIHCVRRSQVNFPPFKVFPTQASNHHHQWKILKRFQLAHAWAGPVFQSGLCWWTMKKGGQVMKGDAALALWTRSPLRMLHPVFHPPVVASFLPFEEEGLFHSYPEVNSDWNAWKKQPWFSTCGLQTLTVHDHSWGNKEEFSER